MCYFLKVRKEESCFFKKTNPHTISKSLPFFEMNRSDFRFVPLDIIKVITFMLVEDPTSIICLSQTCKWFLHFLTVERTPFCIGEMKSLTLLRYGTFFAMNKDEIKFLLWETIDWMMTQTKQVNLRTWNDTKVKCECASILQIADVHYESTSRNDLLYWITNSAISNMSIPLIAAERHFWKELKNLGPFYIHDAFDIAFHGNLGDKSSTWVSVPGNRDSTMCITTTFICEVKEDTNLNRGKILELLRKLIHVRRKQGVDTQVHHPYDLFDFMWVDFFLIPKWKNRQTGERFQNKYNLMGKFWMNPTLITNDGLDYWNSSFSLLPKIPLPFIPSTKFSLKN